MPTVEVEVTCENARPGRAIVPSGASTGQFEAIELRDRDDERLEGTGVRGAVSQVCGEIASVLVGMDASDQAEIDRILCELDGTENKSRLGANAVLGVSLANAYAAAEAKQASPVDWFAEIWKRVPGTQTKAEMKDASRSGNAGVVSASGPALPLPMVNMISGGLHAGHNLDFQDFLALPVGADSYRQALEWIVSIYHRLGRLLVEKGHEGSLVGDEGGYGPRLADNSEAVEILLEAIELVGLRPGEDVAIGLDVAATHFYHEGRYHLAAGGDRSMTTDEFIDLIADWVEKYPIISIEDALADDDWQGWKTLTDRVGQRIQLIGDDFFVTNRTRLEQGIQMGVANSVLIKLNQIGTLSETLETLRLAIDNGYWPVVSARSGETEDTTIADLVVATGAGQIKVGSVARSERLAKYNQLLRLEEQLGTKAEYLGGRIFSSLSSE